MAKDKTISPRALMRTIAQKRPNIWEFFEAMRERRRNGDEPWPEWVYAPTTVSYHINEQYLDRGYANDIHVFETAILAAWRVTQGVYRFDPTLKASLVETPLEGDLPSDLLRRLPEFCCYIEMPGHRVIDLSFDCFFARIDYEQPDGSELLRLEGIRNKGEVWSIGIELGNWTLEEALDKYCFKSMIDNGTGRPSNLTNDEKSDLIGQVAPMVNLVLYLCSERPDIDGTPSRPKPRMTGKGLRLQAPNSEQVWNVGARIGAALRKAMEAAEDNGEKGSIGKDGQSTPLRPHIRRAHWHTFRTGPGRLNKEIKWLPPIAVKVDELEKLPAVVRPVMPPKKTRRPHRSG